MKEIIKRVRVPGYVYEIDYEDEEFRAGVLKSNYDSSAIDIADTTIWNFARELFPERIKEEWK